MRLFCLVLAVPLAAQVGRNRDANAEKPVFQATTQLVVQTVSVNGKDGKPVLGLTAKDFAVTEDGVPQTIRFFEFQKLEEMSAPVTMPRDVYTPPLPRLTYSQIAPEQPGVVRYRNRRLLALYFDFSAMPFADQLRALNAAKRFIRSQMTADDFVALMAYRGGSVEVFQDFTSDRPRLLEIIETLIVGEDENAPIDESARADQGAAFGQNEAEFNIFFTDRQLAALQTAAVMLGRLSEKKSLLYFASGLRLNGANNQAQLSATINAAVRAGVSLWPVDARGLTAQAPLGDATTGSVGGAGAYTGATANAIQRSFQRSQDTLWTLAADTGGKAFLDANDLARGIVEAQRATSSYYIVGYYSSNANPDGKFRRIKITLTGGGEATIDYRQGYFAPKVFGKFTAADKERQLEDALLLPDPVTELTIAMEIGYFQLNRAEYFVPMSVKIPGSELALARKRGADRALIDFIAEIKDSYGTTVSNLRDKVDIKLSGSTAEELSRRPIEYDTGFTLLPGRYRIKFLARDGETGRMGTYEMPFVIPNLNREEKRIAISSVILSSHRAALRDALYSAGKQKGERAQLVSPLVEDGYKTLPSVTRVFSKSKEMFVYLQAYQQGEQPVHPLLAYVTFYRDGEKAMETAPVEVVEGAANRLRTMAIRFRIPLGGLHPGQYDCQVSVFDAAGRKAAFWRAPVMVVD
jgi:VWFA-related protein